MADKEKNKFDVASPTWGDSDPIGLQVENDNKADRDRDGDTMPSGLFAGTGGNGPYKSNNKFDVGGRLGDSGDFGPVGPATGPKDFAADSAGVPNVNQGEKTDMDMGLVPNKFPRQTGHDSLSPEEAQLT